MFGINESGQSCSIIAENFKPFFYIKVGNNWTEYNKNTFLTHIKTKIGKHFESAICDCTLVEHQKLYGFDGGKLHKFIKLSFENLSAFNKVKYLWYRDSKLMINGYFYNNTHTYLYETNIPPLLRFFHIKDISPSGWITFPKNKAIEIVDIEDKKTTCDKEFTINYEHINPLNSLEKRVPYKICSFDIEASSSHGDFPVPIKSYKKLATNIVEYFENVDQEITLEKCSQLLRAIILSAFNLGEQMPEIDLVYPKKPIKLIELERKIQEFITTQITGYTKTSSIMSLFENMKDADDDDDNGADIYSKKPTAIKLKEKDTIVNILCDKKFDRDTKLMELNSLCSTLFPKLEGDKVTFIGSTFLRYGEETPYLNHCAVLNDCSPLESENTVLECYDTEKKVLLAWTNLIQKENPDIIIGYNIFGFDYEFMFLRAKENDCLEQFLQLSKNKDEICGSRDRETGEYKLEESSIVLASGQHDFKYIKMNGRLQVDLYNFFRKEENLTSYKLDFVAGHFIGDYVKKIEFNESTNISTINSGNLMGLIEQSFIHFEEIGFNVDYYNGGQKFQVLSVNKLSHTFTINGKISPDMSKKIRWCLAKDDVTPKDIFRMTNGTNEDRSIIAKYCIQDCNLVQYIMNKVDVLTGFVEMSKICSVPINFLVLRGQGIKLTSYVAKKCREKNTLIPLMEKSENNDGYEGAIVLDPKCDLYLDNPVACVDYASLYPSSMMSENLSHDSKVWTKEYDLEGKLIIGNETGEQNDEGEYIYDNLAGYEYVNITYDTFKYVRKTTASGTIGAAEKIKCGYKICRFAQFPEGKRAIMPSILEELLTARKTTRKLIPQQSDEFMKNVLDKRQLAYKLTANSLYGQCGAKTSTFYEQDVAASTTATGRLLLTYAKRVIEETYKDKICTTLTHGPVLTKAEYIYGDSVAGYCPIYIRVDGVPVITTIELLAKNYGGNNWLPCLEKGKETKEVCQLYSINLIIESWTDQGWTIIYRVIRHRLNRTKKMVRVITDAGCVDVSDDHSLLKPDGKEISPKECKLGDELLHNPVEIELDPKGNIEDWLDKNNIKYSNLYLFPIDQTNENEKDTIGIKIQLKKYTHLEFTNIYLYATKFMNFEVIIIHNYDDDEEAKDCKGKKEDDTNDLYLYILWRPPSLTKKYNKILQMVQLKWNYSNYVYDLTTENHHFAAGIGSIIVHNTDSVFFTFNLETLDGEKIRGKKALEITIELAQEAGHLASSFLKAPHDLEYEKTFMPFCLLSKKRYVGMLYETDPEKCKRKEMGIVLKRRDNAPIVKEIYGGIIDILMKEQDIGKATEFLRACLKNIVEEKYPMDKLIITKSLRSGYKNPKQIAHKVLADRITSRDPGNKPGSGDRIPFVYIHSTNKKALQGEKIETPTYIIENGLKIDYSFYITNQIMKPVQQVFALVLEKIWIQNKKLTKIARFKKDVEALRLSVDPEKFDEKLEKLRNDEVKIILFDEFLRETNNQKTGNQSMLKFFGSVANGKK
jgi:DNA polymerase elongation subunit (family B)